MKEDMLDPVYSTLECVLMMKTDLGLMEGLKYQKELHS